MKKAKGFTLLELLIVIAIIGILIALALPRFIDATNKARSRADDANVRIINTQIELYQLDTAWWPEVPNMESLLQHISYFPDGPPKCPFRETNELGTYTMMPAPYFRVYSLAHTDKDQIHHPSYLWP